MKWCGGWDSNPRRSTPQEPQSCPFSRNKISTFLRPCSGTPAVRDNHLVLLLLLNFINSIGANSLEEIKFHMKSFFSRFFGLQIQNTQLCELTYKVILGVFLPFFNQNQKSLGLLYSQPKNCQFLQPGITQIILEPFQDNT